MPIYGWKRPTPMHCDGQNDLCDCINDPEWEYADTTSLEPPEGGDWQRHYVYSVGKVSNAGGSPSRQVGR